MTSPTTLRRLGVLLLLSAVLALWQAWLGSAQAVAWEKGKRLYPAAPETAAIDRELKGL
ncbi:MAG TPA: hypothetical protein VMQ51_16210 [Candidatus Binatia bacterium]|nr:hypothetical protein [Candidatus Binatia bacterium]